MQRLRNYNVYSCDIDGDGLIELPRLIGLRSLPEDENSKDQSLIEWYNLRRDGQEETKLLTYHNYSAGWYLEIPSSWREYLIVTRKPVLGGGTGYRFLQITGDSVVELFSVTALSGEDAAATMREGNWLTLTQKGDVIYACQIGKAGLARELSADSIREMFHFIHVDWKTGET